MLYTSKLEQHAASTNAALSLSDAVAGQLRNRLQAAVLLLELAHWRQVYNRRQLQEWQTRTTSPHHCPCAPCRNGSGTQPLHSRVEYAVQLYQQVCWPSSLLPELPVTCLAAVQTVHVHQQLLLHTFAPHPAVI
jgi:hypothetical protein